MSEVQLTIEIDFEFMGKHKGYNIYKQDCHLSII
jgi:hypothetical protein